MGQERSSPLVVATTALSALPTFANLAASHPQRTAGLASRDAPFGTLANVGTGPIATFRMVSDRVVAAELSSILNNNTFPYREAISSDLRGKEGRVREVLNKYPTYFRARFDALKA